jgi:hypothetical protein
MDIGPTVPFGQAVILWALFIWTYTWKGIALWRASQLHQRNWFIVMLVLFELTLGILEIIYLFGFAKKRMTIAGIKHWFLKAFSQKKTNA